MSIGTTGARLRGRIFVADTARGTLCDPSCIAIGPEHRGPAYARIPDGIEAGLLECPECRPLGCGMDPAALATRYRGTLGAMLPAWTAPRHKRLSAGWTGTPLGPMLAIAGDLGLQVLEFFDRTALPGQLTRLAGLRGAGVVVERTPLLDEVDRQVTRYFRGERMDFQLPLDPAGSDFARAVWAVLAGIAPATTQSYSDVARALRRPSATRAVAGANAANPLAVLVPCHRVIGAGGALTGYGGGMWRKAWLLDHERDWWRRAAIGGDELPARGPRGR